jgi:hypothetical protein
MASSFGTPVVSLYSGTPPEVNSPHFSDPKNISNIVGYEEGVNPTYNEAEAEFTINNIKPERVASEILNKLSIEHYLDGYETIFTGGLYHVPILECIPDFSPPPEFFPQTLINLRLDYHHDPSAIIGFSNNRRLGLITKSPIESKFLLASKNSIESITYHVDENSDISFIESVVELGLNIKLISLKESSIQETRINLIDWQVPLFISKTKKLLDLDDKICDNTFFKTRKVLFTKDGQFPSKAHWEKKIINSSENTIIDSDQFWSETDHYRIYNHVPKIKK